MFKSKLFTTVLFTLVLSVFAAQAQNARLQVIHNAADPGAASVDIYVNGDLLLNDFGFREATEFIDVPANTELNIGVAPGTSASAADTLKNFAVTLAENETYVAVANGVLNPDNFAANPDGASTAFNLYVKAMAREMAMDSESVEFFVLHGSTDAPTVDVIARDVATLVDDAPYTAMTDYIAVPPASYLLDVTPGDDNNTIVATFEADLSGLTGGAAAVFASGFLTPSANQDGPAFGIFAALPNGTVVSFDAITSIDDEISNLQVTKFELNQNYPNPFNPSTTISFALPNAEYVTVKVFNLVGQEVATLASKEFAAGSYKLQFNANDLGSGIYFYTIQAGDFTQTRRMTVLK